MMIVKTPAAYDSKKLRSVYISSRRRGYALLMCVMVVAVSSSIVLGLFQMMRLQTAETTARRQIAACSQLVQAGHEHALAVLIDQPNFRGGIGPIGVPVSSNSSYSVQIQDAAGNIAIVSTGVAGTARQVSTQTITTAQLNQRRSDLGL